MMIFTEDDKKNYNSSTHCHICKNIILNKVRDHCHITGEYIGAACYGCNINRNYKNFQIPVFFHNGKGYDSHFIINEIANFEEIDKINIIPKTEEKFICYDFNDLKFLDTISFMNPDDSLDKLVKSLRNNDEYDTSKFISKFKISKEYFNNISDDDFKLIITKGIYPYEYMNSFERFNGQQLPQIDDFYSSLNDETIKQKDYDHALKVWEKFNLLIEILNLFSYFLISLLSIFIGNSTFISFAKSTNSLMYGSYTDGLL